MSYPSTAGSRLNLALFIWSMPIQLLQWPIYSGNILIIHYRIIFTAFQRWNPFINIPAMIAYNQPIGTIHVACDDYVKNLIILREYFYKFRHHCTQLYVLPLITHPHNLNQQCYWIEILLCCYSNCLKLCICVCIYLNI